jgi:hypothetical protein
MSRSRYTQGIFLILAVGLFAIAGDAADRTNPIYDGAIDFGSQLVQLNDGCLSFDGTLKSGSFFEDLKRKDIGSRLEFRKHGKVVTEYPESLTTSIRIAGGQCAVALSNMPASIFQGDSYSLKFQVEWKEGMQLRPAVLSPIAAHCVGYSSIPAAGQDSTTPSIACQLTVEGKGVPLVDHLIVSVFAPDGKRLTRLSARP